MPCKAQLFGAIRDRAFEVALAYARDPLLARHPMLAPKRDGFVMNWGQFEDTAPLPKPISELETFASTAVANPLSLRIFRDLLGGVQVEALEAREPMACSL
jgi:hypothetical protein